MKIEIQFLLIFLALWILQGAGLYYQNRSIRLKINELGKLGRLFIGVDKKPFGGTVYALFVVNKNKIVCAKYLRGITIFSKFRDMESLAGLNIREFESEINKKVPKGQMKRIFAAFKDALKKYEITEKGRSE